MCATSGGLVLVRIPDSAERSFSIALAAQMAGHELAVSVDDTNFDSNGFCILRWLNLKNG